MGVINIVKSYPEIFGKTEKVIDEEDAWRTIASAQSSGSNTKKIAFSIDDRFTAVCKLFKLGLRDEAVIMALKVLKLAIKQQHYSIAQQLCNLLVRDSFLHDDIGSAHKYDNLYRSYTSLIELEYQSQLIFGDLLYKYEKGLEYNELEIIRGLHLIEEKLPFDSLIYHYYYHSCQLMIASTSDYEAKLQNAIAYFENQYSDRSDYLSSFVLKLVQYYTDQKNYLQAEVLLDCHLNKCIEGSTVWFKYLKNACLLHLSMGDMIKANDCINKSIANKKFQYLSDKDKKEWNQFRSERN